MKILEADGRPKETEAMEIKYAVGQKHSLSRTSARISVMILALGFSLLGLLSLISKRQVCAGGGVSFEDAWSIIGGATSFLLGWVFLIAGALRWGHSLSR
jgi:hypothetical protein